jgi:hypothetical protein
MKQIFVIILLSLNSGLLFASKNENDYYSDSTIHERFIVNLLSEYDRDGAWLFLEIDSCNNTKSYRIVQTLSLYNFFAKKSTGFDRKMFVFVTAETILDRNAFDNCKHEEYPIQGIKINMKRYNILKKLPLTKILSTYFDTNKIIKKRYVKWLHEIIAVSYENNVKVITPSGGEPYYELFK